MPWVHFAGQKWKVATVFYYIVGQCSWVYKSLTIGGGVVNRGLDMVRIGSLGTDGIEPKGVVMMGKEFVPVAECELAAVGANTVDDVDEWWSRARCRGLPTEMFFVPDGDRGRSRLVRETRAKRVCQSCPVLRQCGTYAVSVGERHGVWGALTPMERAEARVLLGIDEVLAAGA